MDSSGVAVSAGEAVEVVAVAPKASGRRLRYVIVFLVVVFLLVNVEVLCLIRMGSETVRGEPNVFNFDDPDLGLVMRTGPQYLEHKFYDGTADVSTNSEGLRAEMIDRRRPANEFRILCLGDSGTFGTGIEPGRTWPAVLQALLQTQAPPGMKFRVINGGQSGYSAYRAAVLLEKLRPLYKPQVVIAMFGYTDMQSDHTWGIHQKPDPRAPGLLESLLGRSATWLYLRRRMLPACEPLVDPWGDVYLSRAMDWSDASAANMRYMAEYLAANDSKLICISQPLRVSRDEYSIDAPMPDAYNRLKTAYEDMGRRNGVTVVTMDAEFARMRIDEKELFMSHQSPAHLSVQGCRAVAESVAAALWGAAQVPRAAAGASK